MKNKLLLGALLIGAAGMFTACTDDNDSNPTLIQPTEFTLNTPSYGDKMVVLESTEVLPLSWSQPQYTSDNAPINVTYEIQVSNTNSFTVSVDEADADPTLVADYVALSKTYTTCRADLQAGDLNMALINLNKWTAAAELPYDQTIYVRVSAFVQEGMKRVGEIASNVLTLRVAPYFVVLKEADPIMWYLVGNNIADGAWSNKPGISSMPMFLKSDCAYDKATGAGVITYLNYFTTDGWKIQPADFNWDYGFMSGGSANTAVYRDGAGDAGNIWCDPAGYYLVTINTADNTCTIESQDITPYDYGQICLAGSFNGWSDTDMQPVNKSGENHVWTYTMTVADDVVEQVKFKISGSWDTNWGYGAADGEINKCGVAKGGGANIGVPAGTWIIMFNDITGEFSIIEK